MTIAPGVVSLFCLLAPGGESLDGDPLHAEVDDVGFVGPMQLTASDSASAGLRWNAAPRRVEPGSPAWFQVGSWSAQRSSFAILAQSHAWGSATGLPSVRIDQVESAMALAWRPRSSWISLFVALRLTSAAVRVEDGVAVKPAVGAMAGLRIALPSLVDVIRWWRAR